MNDRDLNNIMFILTQTPEDLEAWFNTLDADNQDYALEIVKAYREELEIYELYDGSEIDTTEAKNYLKKFQL